MKSLAPVHRRLRPYFGTVLRRRHGIPYVIDFDLLAKCLNLCRRSIERGVAKLRAENAFNFLTFRVGKTWVVKVWDRHRSIKGVFPLKREKKETRPNQSSGASGAPIAGASGAERPDPDGYEPQASKVAALAACLARGELADIHWDNCKITWRFAHAFRFAKRSLQVGHPVADLVKAYDAAVHQRHKDATDYALNRGCEPGRWEPSSAVSLAAEMLRQDGRTVGQRWRAFFAQPRRQTVNKMFTHNSPDFTSTFTSTPRKKSTDVDPTPEQFLRFLERKGITPSEFMRFSYQMRTGYLDQCRQIFSSTQTTK